MVLPFGQYNLPEVVAKGVTQLKPENPILMDSLKKLLIQLKSGKDNEQAVKGFTDLLSKAPKETTIQIIYSKLSTEFRELFKQLVVKYELVFGEAGVNLPQELADLVKPRIQAQPGRPTATQGPTAQGPTAEQGPVARGPAAAGTATPNPALNSVIGLIRAAVAKSPLLGILGEEMLLGQKVTVTNHPMERVIIKQGSRVSSEVFVVLEGPGVRVDIYDAEGKNIVNTHVVTSGMVGESSIIRGQATNAKVTVLPGTRLLSIPREDFEISLAHAERPVNIRESKLFQLMKANFPNFSDNLIEQLIKQKGVKIEYFRGQELPIVQDATSDKLRFIVAVKGGGVKIQTQFDALRKGSGEPIRVGAGGILGEIGVFGNQIASATVAVPRGEEAIFLTLNRESAQKLYMEQPEFKSYIDQLFSQRVTTLRNSDEFVRLKTRLGFDFNFDGRVPPPVQMMILDGCLKVYDQLLKANPKLANEKLGDAHNQANQDIKKLLEFICKKMQQQQIDNPLEFCSHGADHSYNTFLMVIKLIENSEFVRTQIKQQYGTLEKGIVMAMLMALFHDIGYPRLTEVTENLKTGESSQYLLRKKGAKVGKFFHQLFSAQMVGRELNLEFFQRLLGADFLKKQYARVLNAIGHHGSDSLKQADLDAKRPVWFAMGGENILLALMRFADNLDMLRRRLTEAQTNDILLKHLEIMYTNAQPVIKRLYDTGLRGKALENAVEAEVKPFNDRMKEAAKSAFRAADYSEEKISLLEQVLKKSDHGSFPHFGSVAMAQNIEVTFEHGKIKISVFFNVPGQFVLSDLLNFQVDRLLISFATVLLHHENPTLVVDGKEYKISEGKVYDKDGKEVEIDEELGKKIAKEIVKKSPSVEIIRYTPITAVGVPAFASSTIQTIQDQLSTQADRNGLYNKKALALISEFFMRKGQRVIWDSFQLPLEKTNQAHGRNVGDASLKAFVQRLEAQARAKGSAFELPDGNLIIVKLGETIYLLRAEGAAGMNRNELYGDIARAPLQVSYPDTEGRIQTKSIEVSPQVIGNTMVLNPDRGDPTVDLKPGIASAADMVAYQNRAEGAQPRTIEVDLSKVVYTAGESKNKAYLPDFRIQAQVEIMRARQSRAQLTFAMFSLNHLGTYANNLRLPGNVLMQKLISQRVPEILERVFEGRKVSFAAHADGSGRFYVMAEGVSATEMGTQMQRFIAELSKPFSMPVKAEDLRATDWGRAYLSQNAARAYTHNEWGVEVVDVNIHDIQPATIGCAIRELKPGDMQYGIGGDRQAAERLLGFVLADLTKYFDVDRTVVRTENTVVEVGPGKPAPAAQKPDVVLSGKDFKTTEDLKAALNKIPDGKIVEFRSSQKITIAGKVADIKAWLDYNDAKAFARVVEASARASEGVPAEFIASFIAGRKQEIREGLEATTGKKAAIEVPVLRYQGTKQEILNQLKGEKLRFDLAIFLDQRLLTVQLELLNKLQGQVARKQITFEAAQLLLGDALRAYSQAFEAKAEEYLTRTGKAEISNEDLRAIWERVEGEQLLKDGKFRDYIKYFQKGAPGAGVGGRTLAVGGQAVADAGKGAIVSGLVNLVLEGFEKDPSLKRWFENTGKASAGWAQFGALCGASHRILGLSQFKSMGLVTLLLAANDLQDTKAPKGQVLAGHALGAVAFMTGMFAVGKPMAAIKLPRLGGWMGLVAGDVLARTASYALGKYYETSPGLRSVLDSAGFNATGAALGAASPYLNAHFVSNLLASGLEITAKRLTLKSLTTAVASKAASAGAVGTLSTAAWALRVTNGFVLTLAAVRGGFALHYHLNYGDYEKHIAERFGKSLMDYYKGRDLNDNRARMAGWFIAEKLGGEFKQIQFSQIGPEEFNKLAGRYVDMRMIGPDGQTVIRRYTENQKNFLEGAIRFIGEDFTQALESGRNIRNSFLKQGVGFFFRGDQLSDNLPQDYDTAVTVVSQEANMLSTEITLTKSEVEIYQKIIDYLKTHPESKGFEDPKLEEYVTSLTKNADTSKAVLKTIGAAMLQSQIKELMVINPARMGKNLKNFVNYWVNEAPKNLPNPFKGTAVMRMPQVQAQRDKLAYFFDEKGVLRPGKSLEFARWVMREKYVELRSRQLVAEALQSPDGRVKTVHPEDVAENLVSPNGRINLEHPAVRAFLTGVRTRSAKAAAPRKDDPEFRLKQSKSEVEGLQKRFVALRIKQLELMVQGKTDDKVERGLAWTGKKLVAGVQGMQKAQAEISSRRIQTMALLVALFREDNPDKRSIIMIRLQALGANDSVVITQDFAEKFEKLEAKLKVIDPKKNPKAYMAVINEMLALKL